MNEIECKRVILRRFRNDDFASLVNMLSDLEVMKFTGFRTTQSSEKAKELLEKWKVDQGVWAAVERDSQHFIGWFMLKTTFSDHLEIGFMLPQNQWGKGYATEVALKLIDYAKNELKAKKVIASVLEKNLASIKVLSKIGMTPSRDFTEKEDLVFFETSKMS